jgi:hypothetical protein
MSENRGSRVRKGVVSDSAAILARSSKVLPVDNILAAWASTFSGGTKGGGSARPSLARFNRCGLGGRRGTKVRAAEQAGSRSSARVEHDAPAKRGVPAGVLMSDIHRLHEQLAAPESPQAGLNREGVLKSDTIALPCGSGGTEAPKLAEGPKSESCGCSYSGPRGYLSPKLILPGHPLGLKAASSRCFSMSKPSPRVVRSRPKSDGVPKSDTSRGPRAGLGVQKSEPSAASEPQVLLEDYPIMSWVHGKILYSLTLVPNLVSCAMGARSIEREGLIGGTTTR